MVEQEILNTFVSETLLGEFVEQDLIIGCYGSRSDAEKAFNEFIVRENIIFE